MPRLSDENGPSPTGRRLSPLSSSHQGISAMPPTSPTYGVMSDAVLSSSSPTGRRLSPLSSSSPATHSTRPPPLSLTSPANASPVQRSPSGSAKMLEAVLTPSPKAVERRFGDQDALTPDHAVRVLATPKVHKEDCFLALESLEAATMSSSACHRQVLNGKGAEAVVTTMKAQLAHAPLQATACRVLQHLSTDVACDASGCIARAGGLEAVVAAILAHPTDASVQQSGSHALELLVFGGAERQARAIELGAVEALVVALNNHRRGLGAVEALVVAVLAALQSMLGGIPEQGHRLKEAGTINAVVSAISDGKGDRQVQYWGRLLLQTLCSEHGMKKDVTRALHWSGIDMELY